MIEFVIIAFNLNINRQNTMCMPLNAQRQGWTD